MTNVQFIAHYLYEYPGSRYTDITKALCAWKGKVWTRGTYCRYFVTNPGGGYYNYTTGKACSPVTYSGKYWKKYEGRWYLTAPGITKSKCKGMNVVWDK